MIRHPKKFKKRKKRKYQNSITDALNSVAEDTLDCCDAECCEIDDILHMIGGEQIAKGNRLSEAEA